MTGHPQRLHALDAFRAFALLIGVSFHAAMSFVLPPGFWAVGVSEPVVPLNFLVNYVHAFRMEVFFILAGLFARLVVQKRGVKAFLLDRGIRIALVFVVLLIPMKLALAWLWIWGGKRSGWLQLPPEAASLPNWQLSLGSLFSEPEFDLTHLWFLYCLTGISLAFLAVRWATSSLVNERFAPVRWADRSLRVVLSSWWAPLIMACIATPLVACMKGFDIDTPNKGFAWSWPVYSLYGLCFAMGWQLHRQSDVLQAFANRWMVLLPLSLVFAMGASKVIHMRVVAFFSSAPLSDEWKWLGAVLISLTMGCAVFGWLGLFMRYFNRHIPWVRYLADSSYWIYIAHLPLVVWLQVMTSSWQVPWWARYTAINVLAFPLLLLSYHVLVRWTWLGLWLNGKRPTPLSNPAPTT